MCVVYLILCILDFIYINFSLAPALGPTTPAAAAAAAAAATTRGGHFNWTEMTFFVCVSMFF